MDSAELIYTLELNANPEKAVGMQAYMRDQFPFLGIPTPLRKTLCKDYFKEAKAETKIDWEFVQTCWDKPKREFQYVAVDYLALKQNALRPADVARLKSLAIKKSWWDTIDGLDRIIGGIASVYPTVNKTLLAWSKDKNIWLRRIAIDHQLTRKEQTDTALLAQIIENNLGQTEFFINKAIGWSLREYSKTNPGWVRTFIKTHRNDLAPLSIREGSKYV